MIKLDTFLEFVLLKVISVPFVDLIWKPSFHSELSRLVIDSTDFFAYKQAVSAKVFNLSWRFSKK